MRKSFILLLCIVGCHITSAKGNNASFPGNNGSGAVVIRNVDLLAVQNFLAFSDTSKGNIVYHKKHRAIAAILAFPPFGLFGLHRIYMHTAPGVPFIYIVTAGGLFGVLPFIDFVLILLSKDIHLTYTSNPHLFMWQKR